MIRSIRGKGSGFQITFGTTECRDLSDGQFPVEVWRVHVQEDGSQEEVHSRTCTKASTLHNAKVKASSGWRYNAVRSWIELRTPAARTNSEAP